MTTFVQTLVDTIALGSLYALTALGYTLVYGVLRFINFAHSDIFTVGAWVSFSLASSLGWAATGSPFFAMPVVLLLAMAICAALGILIELLAYRPLRRAPRLNVLITAIGVSLFLQNVGQLDWAFGTQGQPMAPLIEDRSLFTLAGVNIRLVDVVVVVLAGLLMLGLERLVYGTKVGRAMRAVSFDERVASLMGINVNRIVSITFGIGSALAAAGGLLFVLKYGNIKQPADTTWVLLGLRAFVAAVVGGIGNVRGAVAGALLIAFVEQFGAAYLSANMRDLFVFVVLIAVLLFKPSGLFGKAVVEKV
ncbi:MAG: branched-chain amino acid ABC transporter permease [Deltaproteobacteria bacterium]|nr:branched-chain amino acid ABC transporter permease [Deltaproteobacteria bacterium]